MMSQLEFIISEYTPILSTEERPGVSVAWLLFPDAGCHDVSSIIVYHLVLCALGKCVMFL